ncbi:MAG: EAL domain-containing protein [Spirochaetia bacterium]
MGETYEHIVNRSDDFITLIGRDYRYQIVNDSYCKAMERSRDGILGRSVAEVWGEDRFQSDIKSRLDDCLSGNEVHYVDQFRFGAVQKNLHVSFYPYSDGADDQITHVLVFSHDITRLAEVESRLARFEFRDPMTGLLNRRSLEEMMHAELEKLHRQPGSGPRALLFITLKNFQKINQSYGHHIGDLLLENTANRVSECIRTTDLVFRFDGTDLVVLLTSITRATGAGMVAQKIADSIGVPYRYRDAVITIESFIGISICPDDGEDVDQLIQLSNSASVEAEEQSFPFLFHDLKRHRLAVSRMTVRSELQHAFAADQFELHYQPILKLGSDGPKPVGVEALIRWNHPQRGIVEPDDFLDIAEESRLIAAIDKWALFRLCSQLSEWDEFPQLFGTLNVSASEFSDEYLPEVVRTALAEHPGLDPVRLRLELTERRCMDDPPTAIARMQELLEMGIEIWIDDFGTGQSSLTYLKQLPAAALKIDKIFLEGIETVERERAYLAGIVESVRARGKQIVVEGVTNDEQLRIVTDLGCDYAQGFHFARPMAAGSLADYLRKHRKG